MLSRLEIGLVRNAPETNLSTKLCTISIIYRLDGLDLKKRKEPILVWIG